MHDLKVILLKERTWRYLRYLHLREGFQQAKGVKSVLAVGAGKGYAELGLALEFPHIHIHVTDIDGERLRYAQQMAKKWNVPNISFDQLNIMDKTDLTADLVTSIEMLEHIEEDRYAAERMKSLSKKFVFCLVPFADNYTNNNPSKRKRAWENCGHFRPGYDADDLNLFFELPIETRGCYWSDAGAIFRKTLNELETDEIADKAQQLFNQAQSDIRSTIPTASAEAQGIWTLTYI
ncbi:MULTISPECIES: methyltransferase domain-containing protein [unclassified Nitrospina]|uniref:methyltransferase domain-containing protein n=1 Tax=unclassified Nitrospina TaxID=2638683 RepID=UPI003F9D00A6